MREGHTDHIFPWVSGQTFTGNPTSRSKEPFPFWRHLPLAEGALPWEVGHTVLLGVSLLGCHQIQRLYREDTFLSFSYPLFVACLYLFLLLFYFVLET